MDTSQLLLALLLLMCAADSKAYNCTEVTCPHGTVLIEGASAVPCPEDSYRPLVSHMFNGEPSVGADECCLGPCKCKTPCSSPPKNCPANSSAGVLKLATGRPGSCCPKYHCASPDDEDDLPEEPPALALHSPHGSGNTWEPYPQECVSETTGEIMKKGSEWQEGPCITCRCESGKRNCHAYMCILTCLNPHHDPEQCCPVCDSASVVTLPPHCPSLANCSLRCRQGMLKDEDGCFLCQCQSEECNLDCPHGYAEDSFGNKLCECAKSFLPSHCPSLSSCDKNCTHGLHTNRYGCPVCKCNKCKKLLFSSLAPNTDGSSKGLIAKLPENKVGLLCAGYCQYGYVKDDKGCPTCRCNDPPHQLEEITTIYSEDITSDASFCISSDGRDRGENEVWWDGCLKCHCFQGLESCARVGCPPLQNDTQILNQYTDSSTWLYILGIGIIAFVIITMIVIISKTCPWKQGRMFTRSRKNEEDGSDVRLEVSPSPSPTCSLTQKNGSSKVPRYCKENCLASHDGVQEPLCNGKNSILITDCCTR